MRKLKTYQNFNESTEEDVHREMMIKKYGSEEIEEEKTSPKLFLNIKCGSKLWDSNESLIDGVISTIKEFVRSYGYSIGTNVKKEEKRQVTIPITDIFEVEYQMLIQK